jgi:hypothetical protein
MQEYLMVSMSKNINVDGEVDKINVKEKFYDG